jgi:four helix bundle suffix protein
MRSFMIVLIKSGVSPGKMAGDKDRRDKKNQMVYDAMVFFCYRFINKRERTFDQIVQAAQSGQQNIIEFSQASGTSKETEIKLPKEAQGSPGEPGGTFGKITGISSVSGESPIRIWKTNTNAAYANSTAHSEQITKHFGKPSSMKYTFICPNAIIGLIKPNAYLLDKQLTALEQEFLKTGELR